MKRQVCFLMAMLGVLAVGDLALAHPPNGRGGTTPSPDLPPIIPEGYLSPFDVHARYSGPALEVILSMPQHQPFAGTTFPDPANNERHHFESTLHAMVSVNGSPPQPIVMNGPVDTVAYGKCPTCTTGTFDTEMLAMSLTGGPGIMVRESPTRASTGKTSITDIGGGLYHIDSFFDVFTELSVDGGQTWIPQAGNRGTPMYLGGVPEPASVVLLVMGLLGLTGLARRR